MTPTNAPGTQQALNKYLGTSPCARLPLHATPRCRAPHSGSSTAGHSADPRAALRMRPNSPSVRRARVSAPVAPQRPYRADASYLSLQDSKGLETGHTSANAGSSLGEPRASAEQRRQSKALAGKSAPRGAFWERSGLRLGARGARGILGAVPQRRREDAEKRGPAARETEVRRPYPGDELLV